MAKIIHFMSEWLELGRPFADFYKQWETAKPELNKTYKQAKGTWQELTYKIVYVGEGVALGVCIGSARMGNLSNGQKRLFVADGPQAGWQYQDNRSIYRLQSC